MKPTKQEVAKRMVCFENACRTSGTRLTHQRMEIFREVVGTEDHPDAETVHKGVRKRLPMVSLDTVYRTLWLLNDLGLITTLGATRERTRFDGNLDSHHHFTCTRCGLTRDFYSDDLDNLKLPRSAKAYGKIETTMVEVRGICRACGGK